MKTTSIALAMASLICLSTAAGAMTVMDHVTPETVKQNPKAWTIKAVPADGGMIAFTITHMLPEPRYVVASLRIRKGDELILKSDFPAFVHDEKTVTYYFSIAKDHLAHSEFELSASTFVRSQGRDVPLPGSVLSSIRLQDFAP